MAIATSTVVAIASITATAHAARMAEEARREAKNLAKKQAREAKEHEAERLRLLRNSPGARLAPGAFDSLISVFGGSMAGQKYKFDSEAARKQLGLVNEDGSRGPMYGGYDAWNKWSRENPGLAAGEKRKSPRVIKGDDPESDPLKRISDIDRDS